jgi:hypothetical protein
LIFVSSFSLLWANFLRFEQFVLNRNRVCIIWHRC